MKTGQQLSDTKMASADDSWRNMAGIVVGAPDLPRRSLNPCHTRAMKRTPTLETQSEDQCNTPDPLPVPERWLSGRLPIHRPQHTIPNFGALWCGSVRFGALYSVPPLSAKTDHTDFHTGYGPVFVAFAKIRQIRASVTSVASCKNSFEVILGNQK
jgi:hypothetical protein